MNDLNAPSTNPPPSSFEPQLNKGHPWLRLAALLLVVAGGAASLYWAVTRKDPDTAAPVLAPNEPKAEVPPGPSAPVDYPAADAKLSAAASTLSPHAELKDWLGSPEALRRVVGAVQLIAEGESPSPMLGALRPKGEFAVEKAGESKPEKYVMSAKSTARYDAVARVVGSIDAAEVGKLYGQLRVSLEGAFEAIAPPGTRFDAAFGKAVDKLAAVPLSDQPLEVVERSQGVGYVFADPQLEALEPAQKHLLRMGPDNARVIVKQLQAFRAATAR